MSVAKVMRSSTLALFTLLAAARVRVGRSAKITVSVHWTLLTNFYILAHPQIIHCLEDIMLLDNGTNFRKDPMTLSGAMTVISCVHVYARCVCGCAPTHPRKDLIYSQDQCL